ncbi:MAG: DUF3450 domain-containing protein [Puniceicoccales bacterium]|jgi:hypothetical protein|nr:DUF3450 domain-containing protein [Puniceicoccales bacterium]
MVKRKLIGIVVCSILLIGNYRVSVIASQRVQKCALPDSQDEIQQMKSEISKMKREQEARTKELREQEAKIRELQEQLVAESREVLVPFTSLKSAQKYVKKIIPNGEGQEILPEQADHLRGRIDLTINYFREGKGKEISHPQYVVDVFDEWPRCKCIEILHMIKRKIPSVAAFCQERINEYAANVFTYGRLLLMSQCCTWNESERKYELDSCANGMIVKDAIRMLYGITLLPGIVLDDVVGNTKQFLNMIKDKNGFRDYFYFEVE